VDPSQTKVAVLINGQTASAAEIVSGAIQDLDVGVIVGADRTFGKGLVQNVEDLPFDTALKFTVAKYYTPSGRCIQSTKYKEGSVSGAQGSSNDGRYKATKVSESERMLYYTKNGREVRDGGGIEADFKVDASKASALEVTLLRSNVLSDFAAEWSKSHELGGRKGGDYFEVDDATYQAFQRFVMKKHQEGELKLDALYSTPLKELQESLKKSGYGLSSKEVERLEGSIMREMQRDFIRYENDIKEDIGNNILARYLPESMLIERSLKNDKQVLAVTKLLKDSRKFDTLLARSESTSSSSILANSSPSVTNIALQRQKNEGARVNIKW
jgi:carboxyl-terminal processing protease